MSAETWKLEKDLCRCCHAEGAFQNMSEPCYESGQEEIYSDILKSCLGIELNPVQGLLYAMTYTICGACVLRLRDAHYFKQQVLCCEERFRNMYRNIKVVSPELEINEVKQEASLFVADVKVELEDMEGESDAGFDVPIGDSDDEDNNPILRTLLKKKMKAKAKTKTKTKPKAKKKTKKQTARKAEAVAEAVAGSQSEAAAEADADYEDTEGILIKPLDVAAVFKARLSYGRFCCVHCDKDCDTRASLRKHVLAKHCGASSEEPMLDYNQLDHTIENDKFCCAYCDKVCDTRPSFQKHVLAKHFPPIKAEGPVFVLKHSDYTIENDKFCCAYCDTDCLTHEDLQKHFMIKHAKTPEARKFLLKRSDYTIKDGKLCCAYCNKMFTTRQGLHKHIQRLHIGLDCPYCDEKIKTSTLLTVHKLERHNVDHRAKCNACDASFNTKQRLKCHLNNYHKMGEKRNCQLCDFECYSKLAMTRHNVKHKKDKKYLCKFCKKAFLYSSNLKYHEMIHTGEKQKICKECGKAFVQKASLNYHMNKYHPGVRY